MSKHGKFINELALTYAVGLTLCKTKYTNKIKLQIKCSRLRLDFIFVLTRMWQFQIFTYKNKNK